MNRIDRLFQQKTEKVLSVYFTAGYPALDSTVKIIKALSETGADMVEIGIPFSDPVADGPVIQHSSAVALKKGISLKAVLAGLTEIRNITDIPLLIMSYLNPIFQYGVEKFCKDISAISIDGVIIPDLPPEEYKKLYKSDFRAHNIKNIFLITPQTPPDRIRYIDREGEGFLYVVSSQSTTGMKNSFSEEQIDYFRSIRDMQLKNKLLAGFGISNQKTFEQACRYLHGAIVGSAYVKVLGGKNDIRKTTKAFIHGLKNK